MDSEDASASHRDPSRRELFHYLGAGAALAALGGCPRRGDDPNLPYVEQPPGVAFGRPTRYATSLVLDGFATGVIGECHVGRPTKLEGNPRHPASLGASGAFEQAAVLGLYDPDRAHAIIREADPATWRTFLDEMVRPVRAPWFVLHPQSSPLLAALIDRVREKLPQARFTFFSPVDRTEVYLGAQVLFGAPFETQYAFDRARRVLALDADFANAMPMALRHAHDFAAARRPESSDADFCRLYALETALSPTGSLADHRLGVRPSRIGDFAAAVLRALWRLGVRPPGAPESLGILLEGLAAQDEQKFVRAVARDLAAHPGASLTVCGPRQPAHVQLLAHLINLATQAVGKTVTFTRSALLAPLGGEPMSALAKAVEGASTDAVIILDANPVYAAPGGFELGELLQHHPRTAHLSLYRDETSATCRWRLPASHGLERWGDARAYDGTVSLVQPLLRPLVRGLSPETVLAAFAGDEAFEGHLALRGHWSERIGADTFTDALRLGVLERSAFPALEVQPRWPEVMKLLDAARPSSTRSLELSLEPSAQVYDGRFANNGWLQELPEPITKLCWDNAALLAPATAAALRVEDGEVLTLELGGRTLRAPAAIVPGQAEGAVSMALGYGRRGAAENLARGVGADAGRLAAQGRPFSPGLTVTGTRERQPMARTQLVGRAEEPVALRRTAAHWHTERVVSPELRAEQATWLPKAGANADGEQWAMSIDTTLCTGCSGCVIACQAENNVPVVGKAGVLEGRQMHWLRIDRYFEGPDATPEVVHQPMLCQHCEAAPCEYVCPVYATTHSPDGLNEMVYNRCVGTRFCSNNCPYKVRRFNWFRYADESRRALQKNPDVTVRQRGVMEKCTYCVQRIRRAGQEALVEKRALAPGEVKTACQQACATGAIQFGSLRHVDTPMVRWRNESRAYAALQHLGTRPRTIYLAQIKNPNPELV